MSASQALLVLLFLVIKHYIGDFPLQTAAMVANKGIYLHRDGLFHAFVHVVGSCIAISNGVIAVSFVTPTYVPIPLFIALLVGEFLVHYHVDWVKVQIEHRYHLTNKDKAYWNLFGLDQLIHAVTYLVMVWLLL